MATCIIVDGNNLEHYLYTPGSTRVIPLEMDAQLVDALGAWASSQDRKIEVELCLDPRREKTRGNDWVKVFTADPGRQADGMIVGKVSHRVYDGDLCLVITSDEELQSRVAEFQVRCISVRDFVLSGTPANPVFAQLPAKIPKGALPPGTISTGITHQAAQKETRAARHRRPASPKSEYDRLIAQTLAARGAPDTCPVAQPISDLNTGEQPESAQQIPLILLSIATWPLQPGAKFLRDSFCAQHLPDVSGLFDVDIPVKPADLVVLAEFLLDHCGAEPDFVHRGGCLMDRVRLSLLRADGMQLSLQQIADLTGDSTADIRRKVRQNEGRWVKTSPSR